MPKNKPLTLRRNFSWTFIGNAVYAGCQWGMLVVLAKLGSPEMVGQFTLGLAVTAPVLMFTNLQLRLVQATDAKKQYLFSDYLGLRLISTALALLIIAVITLLAGYRWETSLVILLLGLAKAFESISDVFYGLLQQHERMDRIAVSLMIKGLLSLLLLGIGVHILGSVLWGVVGLVFAWAVVLVGYDLRSGVLMLKISVPTTLQGKTTKKPTVLVALQPRWVISTLRRLTWLTIPLGLATMLISLNTNIPRYFIQQYLGERSLGIFAAMSYVVVAGGIVVNALGESASPRLAKFYAAGNEVAFRTLILKLVAISVLLGGTGVLVALVAGREILTFLYRPEYAEHRDVFVWLLVAAAISYTNSFLGYAMTAAHYFKIQSVIFTISALLTAMLCPLFIAKYGMLGAAWVLVIVSCVQTVALSLSNAHAIQVLKTAKVRHSTKQNENYD